MTTDTLERWEKWPAGALVAAAGLNTAIWYAGPTLPDSVRYILPWLVTIAAVAAVVAIDGALIATIAGMRAGRRSWWSGGNIVVTAVFTALAALSAHNVMPSIGPALHGLFALTIVTYAMHLAQAKTSAVNPLVASLQAELTEARRQLTQMTTHRQPDVTIVNTMQAAVVNEGDKRQQIKRLVDGGESITSAARQVGVSRQTASKYLSVKE